MVHEEILAVPVKIDVRAPVVAAGVVNVMQPVIGDAGIVTGGVLSVHADGVNHAGVHAENARVVEFVVHYRQAGAEGAQHIAPGVVHGVEGDDVVGAAINKQRGGIGARIVGVVDVVARDQSTIAGQGNARAGRVMDGAAAYGVVGAADRNAATLGIVSARVVVRVGPSHEMAEIASVAVVQHVACSRNLDGSATRLHAANGDVIAVGQSDAPVAVFHLDEVSAGVGAPRDPQIQRVWRNGVGLQIPFAIRIEEVQGAIDKADAWFAGVARKFGPPKIGLRGGVRVEVTARTAGDDSRLPGEAPNAGSADAATEAGSGVEVACLAAKAGGIDPASRIDRHTFRRRVQQRVGSRPVRILRLMLHRAVHEDLVVAFGQVPSHACAVDAAAGQRPGARKLIATGDDSGFIAIGRDRYGGVETARCCRIERLAIGSRPQVKRVAGAQERHGGGQGLHGRAQRARIRVGTGRRNEERSGGGKSEHAGCRGESPCFEGGRLGPDAGAQGPAASAYGKTAPVGYVGGID